MDPIHQRLAWLRARIQEQEGDAMLVSSAENRRYLSGFRGSSGFLLITATEAFLFTDFRYWEQAKQEAPHVTLRRVSSETPFSRAFAETVAEPGGQRILFEAHHVTVSFYQALTKALTNKDEDNEDDEDDETEGKTSNKTGNKTSKKISISTSGETGNSPELLPVENLIEPLREVKTESEIATLRRAIAITDAAIASVLPLLRPDHTERQVAWMLEVAMRERGADRVAFPIIVAAGRHSAQPHAAVSDEPIGQGRPVIIDMGAAWGGYHADMTRTITLGEPDARFWEVYHLVHNAQQAAIAGIRPGMTGEEADALAREHIAAAGLEKQFGHGLGHGVGLAIHEGPRLGPKARAPLQTGMVFSIEPGVYLEDWGGVRIEDLVLLHEEGCEVLTQTSKTPVIAPSSS